MTENATTYIKAIFSSMMNVEKNGKNIGQSDLNKFLLKIFNIYKALLTF